MTENAQPAETIFKHFKIKDIRKKIRKPDFSENSKVIIEKRYLLKNEEGNPVESIVQMFERVARVVAEPDAPYRDVQRSQQDFYNLMVTKRFFPGSPAFTGAGTDLGQLASCFVLPIEDDMGKSPHGIFSTLKNAALVQQVGGGNGFSFSDLRSNGSVVHTSKGKATGPVGFLRVYDAAFGEIAQGGVRRGANMAVLRVDHPDIRDFIKCKSDEGKVANFNISVALTDSFMEALEKNSTYDLIDPHSKKVIESPRAKEIFDLIVQHAYKNGEPGVLYIDEANRTNPVPHLYELKATNPCGEQWLGPYENCCLGSVNLAEHIKEDGSLDWTMLKESIELATRFLDNVVTANKYVPSVPELKIAALDVRRIGLGFMGLADVMYALGVRYGSKEGQELASQITEFIRYHSMLTSIRLAEERGPFRKITGSIFDPENLVWRPPQSVVAYENDYGRPEIHWNKILSGIKQHGIRNGAHTTIAPTGTIATVAGVEGYGCEPVFALAYYRNVYQAAGDEKGLTLTYTSPLFEKTLDKEGFSEEKKRKIVEQVIAKGTCKDVVDLPEHIKNTFVVSSDITSDEHIRMQSAVQAFIDNSISKTCNLPADATEEDVAAAYILGWKLKCKGLTVYVTGSRQEVVLETKETKDAKESMGTQEAKDQKLSNEISLNNYFEIDRGYKLSGNTYRVQTPQGKAFITINRGIDNSPLEIFINVGKAGSDVSALSEALGRLCSGWLRSSADRGSVIKDIVVQLIGIGGANSVGFGKNRIGSIPDAVAKVIAEDFDLVVKANGTNLVVPDKKEVTFFSHTDMCPDCGNATLVLEEGCAKCYTCGYSRC